MKDAGTAAVVVVRSAAKAGWWTTKFAANHVAKPVIVKAAPAAGKYALKQSAKYLLPFAVKLSIL